ncbi:MAG: regulator [Chitinispirillaceae bacterium]|nr:regulator [Chitinispirillaceae bacterium]
MAQTPVVSAQAPAPIGPYRQAIDTGAFVFISGQLPLEPESGDIAGVTIEEQATRAIRNLLAVLSAAGLDAHSLVKTTVFLRSMADFAAFNAVYERLLGGAKPARSVLGVAALPRGAMIEIEAIACR